jgi:carbon-monoxide dehydrogenase medium subunit
MKPPAFAYYDPRTIDEAVCLLAQLDNARLLAGGQSLMPMLNMRYAFPDHLIDLNRIGALAGISRTGNEIRIGAMARQRDIEDNDLVREHLPLMIEALSHVGHRQTRNRGTIGGSLCHLDPAAELVAVTVNLDATIEIASPRGNRELAMSAFPLGYLTPAIEADEMVTAVRVPMPVARHGYSFIEIARRHGDFAIVSVSTVLVLDERRRIDYAAITLGGVNVVPIRMHDVEAMLIGNDAAVFQDVVKSARSVEAQEDSQVPRWYRQQVAEVLMGRSLMAAYERAGGNN